MPKSEEQVSLGHRAALSPFCSFIDVDLANALELREVFQEIKCEGVIHFAAYTQVGESASQPGKYWQNNLIGTQNLLEAMNSAAVRKLVFSSTAAVYGNPGNQTATGILESSTQVPINTYGRTKKAMELLTAISDALRQEIAGFYLKILALFDKLTSKHHQIQIALCLHRLNIGRLSLSER